MQRAPLLWCLVVVLASAGSAKKKAAPAAAPPAANGDAVFVAAVADAIALTITPAQLETKCAEAFGRQPDAVSRCAEARADMTACVTAYPAPGDTAARKQCFELRAAAP